MVAGRVCGRVCDWEVFGHQENSPLEAMGVRDVSSGLKMGRAEKGTGFYLLGL